MIVFNLKMRPTDLHFRPPRERTAEYVYPHVSHPSLQDHSWWTQPTQPLKSLNSQSLWSEKYDIYKWTTFWLCSGKVHWKIGDVRLNWSSNRPFFIYNRPTHCLKETEKSSLICESEFTQRPLVAGPEPSRGGYVYDGNHLLFDFTALQEY